MRNPTRASLIACIVLLLASNGYWLTYTSKYTHTNQPKNDSAAAYPLLSKRIFTDAQNDMLLDFVPLRKKLQATFDTINVQKSFYFEYLPSGTSIKIGADNELIAASLIKVPLCMNLYKASELGKVNLDKKVTITQAELDNAYGSLWQKGAGTTITLRQAAQLALEQSDNTATHVIFDAIQGLLTSDQESLNNLDIDQNMSNGQAVIDAKSYSSILKSLYLSSYLERNDSEEILSYLSRSDATNRLTKDLPSSVTVAHKIGVYNAQWSESDCGIVYVPKRPYVLCIMVGLPEDQANSLIADVSKQIYDFINTQ